MTSPQAVTTTDQFDALAREEAALTELHLRYVALQRQEGLTDDQVLDWVEFDPDLSPHARRAISALIELGVA